MDGQPVTGAVRCYPDHWSLQAFVAASIIITGIAMGWVVAVVGAGFAAPGGYHMQVKSFSDWRGFLLFYDG